MLINAATALEGVKFVQGALKVLASLQLTSFKYPEQTCVFDGAVYDYIVVGAGTAGCVVASRLVEDNKSTVLLIEAGTDPHIETDLASLALLLKTSDGAWNYTIEDPGISQQTHRETVDDMSLGRGLGGTSTLSYLLYSTGSQHDYNEWAKLVNDTNWNWENVLPYLKKSQRVEDATLRKSDRDFFGFDGKIGLTVARSSYNIKSEPYFKIVKEIGVNVVPSINGNVSLGYTSPIITLSNQNVRQQTAFSYLLPIKDKTNLHVLKNTLVTKIFFDEYKNAIGVQASICNKRLVNIMARKEVIISAGIVNSPKLLMLSGIGPNLHLCRHKIQTISDLPVGEDFQDKQAVIVVHNMTKQIVTNRPFHTYKFGSSLLVGHVALNNSYDYPDYQALMFVSFPRKSIQFCMFVLFFSETICNNLFQTALNSELLFNIIIKQRFKSRGRILLKSNDYRDDPIIYSGYYSIKEDIADFAELVLDYVKIKDSKTFKKLGGMFKDPKLDQCEFIDKNTLDYWKCYVPLMSVSRHQYTSTCAMGKVVDSRLRVYGVNRLRVVDASVMPHSPAGGTLGPTIMIGEKAADMIVKDNQN